jgi:uncharacterized protein
MKIVLAIVVLLLAVWLIRSAGRRADHSAPSRRRDNASQMTPQSMLACAHCGVHVPQGEAVSGARGSYCTAAHRSVAEG